METEILRGAKVRITTETAQVGNDVTRIADIQETVITEADRGVRLLPMVFFITGPLAAAAVQIVFNAFVGALAVCIAVMGIGAVVLRNRWQNQVRIRLNTGGSIAIYRTPRIADARLFHAALLKAMELREVGAKVA